MIVQWPPEDSTAGKLKAGANKLTFPYSGIRDKDRLIEIAKSIYEEIGRSEIAGEASTDAVSSLGGDNNDPDVVSFQGDSWTVFRVERWDHTGQVYYKVTLTRETKGSA